MEKMTASIQSEMLLENQPDHDRLTQIKIKMIPLESNAEKSHAWHLVRIINNLSKIGQCC